MNSGLIVIGLNAFQLRILNSENQVQSSEELLSKFLFKNQSLIIIFCWAVLALTHYARIVVCHSPYGYFHRSYHLVGLAD